MSQEPSNGLMDFQWKMSKNSEKKKLLLWNVNGHMFVKNNIHSYHDCKNVSSNII